MTCTRRPHPGAHGGSGRRLLRRTHPITPVNLERKRIAHQLLADVRRLDRQITTASQAIGTAVRDHGTT